MSNPYVGLEEQRREADGSWSYRVWNGKVWEGGNRRRRCAANFASARLSRQFRDREQAGYLSRWHQRPCVWGE